MENVLEERAKQPKNQENDPVEEIREETEEVEVEVGEERAFFMEKREEAFKKSLTKKGFVEEIGFKELVLPFKEDIERIRWEMLSEHIEPGRRALVKEFYANLGDRRNLTYYVRERWVPFGERAIS